MKKQLMVLTILLLVCLAGSLFAEVKLSGEARVRPRLDLKDAGDFGDKSTNSYYCYYAKLNLKSDIGDGWFAHIQLGTNGYGYFTGIFADPEKFNATKPHDDISVDGASRSSVDFMLVYFGRKTERFGYMGGVMPVNGIANPMLDLHYYSDQMVDVPYYIFSNNGAHGFSGYIGLKEYGKINASIFVDDNKGQKVENSSGVTTEDTHDQYSIMIDAPLTISDFLIQPVFLMTAIARDSMPAPLTLGVNLTSPKVGNFNFGGSFGISSQNNDGTAEYDAWYLRGKVTGKIGIGSLTAWYDLANKTFDIATGDEEHKFGYFWLCYNIPVYKSEFGSVSVKPTWRRMTEKVELGGVDTKDYKRDKIELTIDFSFK